MANVLFGLARPLRVQARLRPAASASASGGADAAALDSCVVARTVDERQARIAVHVPAAGEYRLEVYTCDPQRTGDQFLLAWQYLLIADAPSPVRFPQTISVYCCILEFAFTHFKVKQGETHTNLLKY